jgi:hypothetical protein
MTAREIPAPVCELLAAVLEAIDLPYPATVGDSERYHDVLEQRVAHVAIALRGVLHDRPLMGAEWEAEYLRERLAEHPPTGYRHVDGEGR